MNKELSGSIGFAVLMLALSAGGVAAQRMGYVSHETVERVVIGVMGLWMVWYGNRIPKRFAPSACARKVQRVSAWSTILSGLVYAGVWAFAPIDVATWAGSGAVFAGALVTLGYCLSLRAAAPRAGSV